MNVYLETVAFLLTCISNFIQQIEWKIISVSNKSAMCMFVQFFFYNEPQTGFIRTQRIPMEMSNWRACRIEMRAWEMENIKTKKQNPTYFSDKHTIYNFACIHLHVVSTHSKSTMVRRWKTTSKKQIATPNKKQTPENITKMLFEHVRWR